MQRTRRAVLVLVMLVLAGCSVAAGDQAEREAPAPSDPASAHWMITPSGQLEVVQQYAVAVYVHAAVTLDVRAYMGAVHEAKLARASRRYSGGGSVPNAGGDCYARAPAGFPPGVIDRESGGNTNAHNPSGAHGCAQLMPEHFQPGRGCYGLSYDACWAKLWNGGAGASNWSQTL